MDLTGLDLGDLGEATEYFPDKEPEHFATKDIDKKTTSEKYKKKVKKFLHSINIRT